MTHRIAVLILLVFGSCGSLFGQSGASGQLNGTVTDQSGAAVANAKVTVVNRATNLGVTVLTSPAGQYRIFNLLPSLYDLTIEAPGFKTVQIAGLKINVDQTLTQDSVLSLGSVAEKVEVSAQADLLERTTVSESTVIQEKVIQDLPLNGRDYSQLITLTPGANGTRINGQWGDGNRFLLDGTNNTTILGSKTALTPNLDTIQEFSVDSHSAKAEYGGFLGATINVATKSGGNTLSGTLWEFVRSNQFQARNPFSQATLSTLPPYHRNQFGAAIGGPVYVPKLYEGRNKTFFFFAYERFTVRQHSVVLNRVPTADELNGNFSTSVIGRNIYDPTTTTVGPGGTLMRQQFPNNIIPTNRVDSLTQGYLKLMLPTSNYSNTSNVNVNRLDIFPNDETKNNYSVRIDHKLSHRDNLWFRYSQVSDDSSTLVTAILPQLVSQNRKNLGVSWVHAFRPNLFFESTYTYSDFPFTLNQNLQGGQAALAALGFSQDQLAKYGIPDFLSVGNFSTPYLNGVYANYTKSPASIGESLSWTTGKHSTKFGFQLSRKDFTNIATGHHYNFNVAQTADPQNVGTTGIELASLLLGLPQSNSLYTGNYTMAFNNWSLYGEDDWKFRQNLTVSLGVRYDSFPPPNFYGSGSINDWDYKTGDWLIGGGKLPPACNVSPVAPCIPGTGNLNDLPNGNMIKLAQYPGIRYPIHDNFSPRLGVAWSFARNTVLRAGYGIYFDTESSTAQEAQNTYGAWPSNTSAGANYNDFSQSLTTVNQIDKTPVSPTTTGVPWGTVSYFWDPRKKDAMSQQWNVDIQHQFSEHFVLTSSYVGSRGSRLDLNIAANTALQPGAGTPAEVNARRPFPFYGSDTLYGTDLGRNDYNALQIKAERRFSAGFQALVSYTLSRTTDNGTDGWYVGNPQNPYNLSAEWGPSNSDRTHILVMSGVYELPFGRGKKWLHSGVASYVLGNWQMNGIGTLRSGTPVVLSVPGDVANVGNDVKNYERPNRVGDPHLSNPSAKQWFNPGAFAVPVLAFGDAKRGLIRNPGYTNFDLSLFKNFPIRERLNLQLRFEAFNGFNIQSLGNANGTLGTGFGQITSSSSTPRELQFGAKLYF